MATLDWLIREGLSEKAICKLKSECQDAKMVVEGGWGYQIPRRTGWIKMPKVETNLACSVNRQKVTVAKALLERVRIAQDEVRKVVKGQIIAVRVRNQDFTLIDRKIIECYNFFFFSERKE